MAQIIIRTKTPVAYQRVTTNKSQTTKDIIEFRVKPIVGIDTNLEHITVSVQTFTVREESYTSKEYDGEGNLVDVSEVRETFKEVFDLAKGGSYNKTESSQILGILRSQGVLDDVDQNDIITLVKISVAYATIYKMVDLDNDLTAEDFEIVSI